MSKDTNFTQDQNALNNSETKADEHLGTKDWTQEGDGTGYPEGTDGYHSGLEDYEGMTTQQVEQVEKQKRINATHPEFPEHDHVWRDGLTNDQRSVKICRICGVTEGL